MTGRVTTLKGPEAGRYYTDELGSYYLDGDEPPGVWHGRGAAALGLQGPIDENDFLLLMDGKDPSTGKDLGSRHVEKSVRGFDVTFSAPKSVSLLYAFGEPSVRSNVLGAHDAAVNAALDWFEGHAHTRFRVHGDICTFDAEGIVVATFRQHVSRALDPQLHTHAVIPNRVAAPDGRWLALDAKTLKRDQRTLSALYHAALRAELTSRLGVQWDTREGAISELQGVPVDVRAAFSTRAKDADKRLQVKIERFAANFERAPTSRERWQLERESILESRPSKTSNDAPTLAQEWVSRLLAAGESPTTLIQGAVGKPSQVVNGQDGLRRVMAAAVEHLSERQSTWRSAEVSRELAAALPPELATDAAGTIELVETLRATVEDELLLDLAPPAPPAIPRRRDGRPITESAVDRVFTTPEIREEEETLIAQAAARLAAGGSDAHPGEVRSLSGITLGGAQLEAAAGVAGDRQLVLVVGPAGTGKTTALRPAVESLRRRARSVFGIAPSATAAEVLGDETGLDTDTIDKLLAEHQKDRPDPRFRLASGSTIVVDEAAMVSTANMAQLFNLADQHNWRLALIGDPLQFSAVGRSGIFNHLVESFGAVELDQVHRFSEAWERKASLRLRRGDASVVDEYDRHGRLHGGSGTEMLDRALDAWWQARSAGQSVALVAPTNEAVIELNLAARRKRIDAEELNANAPTVKAGPYEVGVGDEVATRRNDRTIRTDRGQSVKNRAHWTVQSVHADGVLTVSGKSGSVRLTPDYVAEFVDLAYAETSHASQGRTVDHSYLYLDGSSDCRGVYVPLTRGRITNEAFVTVMGNDTPADIIGEAIGRTWVDRPSIEVEADFNSPKHGGNEFDTPPTAHRMDSSSEDRRRQVAEIRLKALQAARRRAETLAAGQVGGQPRNGPTIGR